MEPPRRLPFSVTKHRAQDADKSTQHETACSPAGYLHPPAFVLSLWDPFCGSWIRHTGRSHLAAGIGGRVCGVVFAGIQLRERSTAFPWPSSGGHLRNRAVSVTSFRAWRSGPVVSARHVHYNDVIGDGADCPAGSLRCLCAVSAE